VVEHVRGASSTGGIKAARVERNRRLLRARWRSVLDRRPPESTRVERSGLIGGRDALTCERILVLTGPRPNTQGTPEQRRLHSRVSAAAARWPEARWTVASLDGAPVTRTDDLGDLGIEAVTAVGSWDSWLAGRRYHYGVVATTDPRWDEGLLDAALTATQPQAARISAGDGADLGEVAARLGRPLPGIRTEVR
jgi:hypothetical protein